MASRGSKIKNGHITTNEYYTKETTLNGVKILIGYGNNHSLPDYSYTPNSIYAKMKPDGVTLHEMRFYGDDCFPIIEIAYHPEPQINKGNRETNIVYFHYFKGIDRAKTPFRMDEHPEVKEKYKEYLKEFNLYDKC